MGNDFNGGNKKLDHLCVHFERKIIKVCLPWVPSWLTTIHLTLMTFGWSFLVILFGYWAGRNESWLWASDACILFQYLTDMLDGEVGRQRGTGLVRWGFYMDHFLDYIFLCAVIVGYSFILPVSASRGVLLCLAICAGFAVHALLDFGITNDFKISFDRVGVTEVRYGLVIFNVFVIYFGKAFLIKVFPFIVLIFFILLCIVIYRSQKIYRRMDEQAR